MNTPKSTIRLYLLLSAMFDLGIAFIGSIYVLFLLSKGLNIGEASWVNVAFYLTLGLLEIPTGVFADIYGRKKSFLFASGFFSLGLCLYGTFSSFWGFALAESITAIGATFISGAFQAWMKDQLAYQGMSDIRGVLSVHKMTYYAMSAFGSVVGIRLYEYSPSLPWFVGAAATLIAGIIAAIWMREDYFVRRIHNNSATTWRKFHEDVREGGKRMRQATIAGIRYGLRSEPIRFLLVLGLVQQFGVTAPNMQWQPFFAGLFGGADWIGWLRVGMVGLMALGAALAPWCLRHIRNERLILTFCQIIIGLGIMVSAYAGKTHAISYAVVFFLLHEIARGLFGPAKDAYLHDQVPSEARATMLSVEAMSHHIGGGIGLVVSGWLALQFGIATTWIVFGLLLTLSAAVNFHRERKNGKK